MKLFHLVFIWLLAIIFTACAVTPNRVVYLDDKSDIYAFNVEQNSTLQNPPADKSRVYVIRPSKFEGRAIANNLYFQYNPKLSGDQVIIEKAKYKDNIAANVFNGSKTHYDFEPGSPLLLIIGSEKPSYIVFTPKAGKIYCTEGESVAGWWIGRFNLKFIDRVRCEEIYAK